ncbi:MAG: toll/interleukin-1 receptor domain-containing protein [Deltaproteobacteria bacterium]|nr:toll/interleukin-1 receptor domain-containing protein [Deltaproteobacteria bacterium]
MAAAPDRDDFLLSYASVDEAWALWVAGVLRGAGFAVASQPWEFGCPGGYVLDLDDALDRAARVMCLVSDDYTCSPLCVPRWKAELAVDPERARALLLPVRVDDSELFGPLREVGGVDLFDADEATARRRLLDACGPCRRQVGEVGEAGASGEPLPPWPQPMSPIWNIPIPRDPHFTGRDGPLAELRARFGAGERVVLVQSTRPHGGEGLSALAREHAWRWRGEYSGVCWVRASDEGSLLAGLQALARRVQARGHDHESAVRAARAGREWLERRTGWLLILDDADQPELVRQWLPRGRHGHVLLTTRRSRWGGELPTLELGPLAEDDALALLERRAGGALEPRGARALVRELELRPLGLGLAGATLGARGRDLDGYRERLAEHLERVMDAPEPDDAPALCLTESLVPALHLAVETAARQAPAAPELLALLCCFASDRIPWDLLATEASALDGALAALEACGLIQRAEAALSMHPLVPRLFFGRLGAGQRRAATVRAAELLLAAFPDDTAAPESWPAAERLAPHVDALRVRAHGTKVASAQAAELLTRAGRYAGHRLRWKAAASLCERALRTAERACGRESPQSALCLHDRAEIAVHAEPLLTSRILFGDALRIRRATLGPAHPETARSARALALAALRCGPDDGGGDALERLVAALEMTEAACGADHVHTAEVLFQLAQNNWKGCAEMGDSRALYQRALAIFEVARGPTDGLVVYIVDTLSEVTHHSGDADATRALLDRSLESARSVHGLTHPTAARHERLGSYLEYGGDLQGALDHYGQALAIYQATLGDLHRRSIEALEALARIHEASGDLPTARRHHERLLALGLKIFGPAHGSVQVIVRKLEELAAAPPAGGRRETQPS